MTRQTIISFTVVGLDEEGFIDNTDPVTFGLMAGFQSGERRLLNSCPDKAALVDPALIPPGIMFKDCTVKKLPDKFVIAVNSDDGDFASAHYTGAINVELPSVVLCINGCVYQLELQKGLPKDVEDKVANLLST